MFSLFHRHAVAQASCSEPAVMTGMPMQAAHAPITDAAPGTASDTAPADTGRPATYEEMLPYLMLAMVSAI